MNAPQDDLVLCPTCKGTKKQTRKSAFARKHVTGPCFACGAQGRVEASRVCPICGDWAASHSHDGREAAIIARVVADERAKKNDESEPDMTSKKSKPRGMNFDITHRTWKVSFRRDNETCYLGTFRENEAELAEALALEAGNAPTEQFPALREKYRALQQERRGKPATTVHVQADRNLQPETAQALNALINLAVEAVETGDLLPEDEAGDEDARILALVRRARAAERCVEQLREASRRAEADAERAYQDAVSIWREVREALAEIGGDAFADGMLSGRVE